jgi:hypothetical protein
MSPWPNSKRSAMLDGSGRGVVEALGEQLVVDDRRVRLHCLVHVGDVGQDLVLDLDQFQGLAGNRLRHGCHGGDGVAVIERLAAGHDIFADVEQAVIAGPEILCSYNGVHPVELFGPGGVDPLDFGVGMR